MILISLVLTVAISIKSYLLEIIMNLILDFSCRRKKRGKHSYGSVPVVSLLKPNRVLFPHPQYKQLPTLKLGTTLMVRKDLIL